MNITTLLSVICLLFGFAYPQTSYAQKPTLSFRHFTTADGLPSSETYFTLEDSKGYIWIGTDNGLARFDGYDFRVFDRDDGLKNAVVFVGLETEEQDFWVSTYTGECFRLDGEVFVPYQYNNLILELKQKNPIIKIIDVLKDGSVVLVTENQGMIRISPYGELIELTDASQNYLYIYTQERPSTRFSVQVRLFEGGIREPGKWSGQKPVMFVDARGNKKIVPNIKVQVTPRHTVVMDASAKDSGVLVASKGGIVYFQDSTMVFQYRPGIFNAIHYERYDDHTFFISSINGGGLIRAELDIEQQQFQLDTVLRAVSVSMSYLDTKGGLWVNCLNEGVYYCSNPAQRLIRLKGDDDYLKPRALALGLDNDVFVGYGGGNVFRHQEGDPTAKLVKVYNKSTNGRYTNIIDIYHEDRTQHVLFLKYEVFPDQHGNYSSYRDFTAALDKPYSLGQYYTAKRFRNFGDHLLWANSAAFGKFDLERRIPVSRIPVVVDPDNLYGFRCYAIFPDGREFVGTLNGLREVMPDSTLRKTNLGIPALDERIEDMVQLNATAVAIGTRGKGLVYYGQDTSYTINVSDGLASDNIRNLHVSDDESLWIATFRGVSKVTFINKGMDYQLRTFTTGRGLVDNEVHDVDSRNNEVWLASTAGVYRFEEPPIDSVSNPPILNWIRVNGKRHSVDSLNLAPRERNVSFQYTTTILSIGDKINYRYRVSKAEDWQESQSRIANYPSLQAGEYTFEVQSQNIDGVWSKSLSIPFSIEAYFMETWKPWAIGLLLGFVGLFIWFTIRENNRRREQELLLRINELEHSALHAQMNPHFVFNSLNSIQNFVLHNKTREAATYLSRFATLIRATLRASVHGQHALAEEVKMLNGYLELEKLRFKEVFDYQITVDPELPQEDITIPPLLVQPFVENAILHGLRECTSGGIIEVGISGDQDLLLVTIRDNGVGINLDNLGKDDSYGMAITRERLKIMSEERGSDLDLSIAPATEPDGRVAGTLVTLRITPLNVTPIP